MQNLFSQIFHTPGPPQKLNGPPLIVVFLFFKKKANIWDFFIKKSNIMQKKRVEEKEKIGKKKIKKLVAARIELGTFEPSGEGTVSCIWKLGTSIENRGSMALQV